MLTLEREALTPPAGGGSLPRLLVLSHVVPFPPESGQVQRVAYMLRALRKHFHVTLATVSGPGKDTCQEVLRHCDRAFILRKPRERSAPARVWGAARARLYASLTGLKTSNYWISNHIFSESNVSELLRKDHFDCVLFEYWHAAARTDLFHERNVPCVLDMHDVLWRAQASRLKQTPGPWSRWKLARYRKAEESAWRRFDVVVAINREELNHVRSTGVPSHLLCAPMGIETQLWPYSWQPALPRRIAYYGGLSSKQNQDGALKCWTDILPRIWSEAPETQFWIVGSKPPQSLQKLATDPRIKVTGFVSDVGSVLREMTAVLCPWVGTYGFRSRLVEAMSLGVPVVVSPDAVYGMDIQEDHGMLIAQNDGQFADHVLRLLGDPSYAESQSRAARRQVEERFNVADTYGQAASDLRDWLGQRLETKP